MDTTSAHRGALVNCIGRCYKKSGKYPKAIEAYQMMAFHEISVHPDGRRIAFTQPGAQASEKPQIVFESDRDGKSEIYVIDADGTNPRNLTNHPAKDIYPDWFDPAHPHAVPLTDVIQPKSNLTF